MFLGVCLGTRVFGNVFRETCLGKRVSENVVQKGEESYYVDGISGATVTSNGVNAFLKEALLRYEGFAKKLRAKEAVI